jgi:hypothetical protein
MNEESRPARRLPNNLTGFEPSSESGSNREHELDRMIAAAVYRRERAQANQGLRFDLPPSLRKKAA